MLGILAQTVTNEIENLVDVSTVTPWDLLWAALLVVGGVILSGLLRRLLKSRLAAKTSLPSGTIDLLAKTVGWGVISLGVVFALPYLGVAATPMVVLILIIGVILAVSGRALVENYGAGIVLQAEGYFEPGDQILTNGQTGKVIEVGSRVLRMETLDGRRFLVPNTSVLSGPVEVFTSQAVRRSELVVGLEYGTDLEFASAVLAEAAAGAHGVVPEPPVEVFVSEFADSSIDFLVWFWHTSDLESGYEAVDSVAKALDRACKANDLTIAFPQRTLWSGDTTAPESLEL